MASAPRWSTRCRNGWKSMWRATSAATRCASSAAMPMGKLKELGAVNRRGTIVTFKPDTKIFGDAQFSPARLYRMAQVQGLSVPRRGNPLGLRSLADQGRNAGGRHAEISRRPARFSQERDRQGQHRHAARLLRPHRKPRRQRARWNGRWPGRRRSIPSSAPIATPFPRRRAARMNRACAMP